MTIELGDDVRGQGPALLVLGNGPVGVAPAEGERRAEPGQEPHLGGFTHHKPRRLGHRGRPVRRELLASDGRPQRAEAQQEPVDVRAPQGSGVEPSARPAGQDRRQHPDGTYV